GLFRDRRPGRHAGDGVARPRRADAHHLLSVLFRRQRAKTVRRARVRGGGVQFRTDRAARSVYVLTLTGDAPCNRSPISPFSPIPLSDTACRRVPPASGASTRSRSAGCRRGGRRLSAAGRDPARRCSALHFSSTACWISTSL